MAPATQASTQGFAERASPRIIFVLGKGGVGRSSVATALGLARAAAGERTLIVEWAVADCIAPWFGHAPAGPTPLEVSPRLWVTNFALEEALRAYFVDHLKLGRIYRRVIRARSVARLLEVAPGLAEMFFLGQLWWLTELAEREAGWAFDRIVVDAPATGHAASLLDVPAMVASMATGSLLTVETERVTALLADPARTGAVVVSLPEPMVVEETQALLPRVAARLGAPPLALIVNRSAGEGAGGDARPAWLAELGAQLSPGARGAIEAMHAELVARVAWEEALRAAFAGPVIALPELPGASPLEVARAGAHRLAGALTPGAGGAPATTPVHTAAPNGQGGASERDRRGAPRAQRSGAA